MPTVRPEGFDCSIGIGKSALNKSFTKIFGGDGDGIPFELKGRDWSLKGGMLGAPRIDFLPGKPDAVHLTLPFAAGRLKKASVNLDNDEVTTKTYDLAGKHISFETPLCRVRHPELHDRNFTAEAIYVDLASVSNIDALSLAFDPGDLSSIGEVLKGLVAELQKSTKDEEPRLFLGGVKVPNTPDTVGPLAPTGGVLAAACQADAPQAGEIEFLLMTQGRPIPAEAEGRIVGFARPLTDLMKGHDAVELIGDGLLLQHLARPALEKAFPGIKLALTDGPPGKPATLVQKGDLKLPHRGMHVRRAEAHRKGAAIDIRCDLETREQLQTGDGAADVDFSLFKVIITKSLRFTLLPKVDEKGCLAFEVREDPKNRAEPEHKVEFDGSVHGIKDLLKYVAAPAMVALGPAVGSFVVVFVGVVEGLAIAIQAGIVDAMDTKNVAGKGLGVLDSLDASLELPGDPVFVFRDVAEHEAGILVGADYVDPPRLSDGKVAPYAIAPFPKVKSVDDPMPPETTEPVLIGEVALKYRYVRDPRFPDRAKYPGPLYYILRREQFWKRTSQKTFPAHRKVDKTTEVERKVTKTEAQTVTETLSMTFSAGGTLQLLDVFSPEVKAEIERELKVETETTVETETAETVKVDIEFEARDEPFGIAVWWLAERYTLMRGDDIRSVVNRWDVLNENYCQVDDYGIRQSAAS